MDKSPRVVIPFQPGQDTAYLRGPCDQPPALIFNPNTTREMLLSALVGRTKALKDWLFFFAVIRECGEVDLQDLFGNLHSLAEELHLIVDEVQRRDSQEGQHHG